MEMYLDAKARKLAFQIVKGIDTEAFLNAEENVHKKEPNQVLREKFFEVLGVENEKDRKLASRIQSRMPMVCELVVDILVEQIPNILKNNPLLEKFTEFKDINFGDLNAFQVNDSSLFTVSTFSGGHWDTDRQKIRGLRTVPVPTEWYYVHVYDEFWNFITGRNSFENLVNKTRQSIMFDLQYRINANFNNAPNMLPTELRYNGTVDTVEINRIAQLVASLTDGRAPIFAGTKMALSKLRIGVADPWVSDHMADTVNKTGVLTTWDGYETFVLPSVVKPGTFTLEDNQNSIFILSADATDNKIIKVVNEGTPLINSTMDSRSNQDMTIDYQLQYKMGTALVMNSIFGFLDLD